MPVPQRATTGLFLAGLTAFQLLINLLILQKSLATDLMASCKERWIRRKQKDHVVKVQIKKVKFVQRRLETIFEEEEVASPPKKLIN